MIKDKIMVEAEGCKSFDKMQLALAIRNSTYEDELGCSMLDNGLLKNCESCSLKSICEKIDEVAEEYLKSTTEVVSSFNFS
jgi:hypothetical protein